MSDSKYEPVPSEPPPSYETTEQPPTASVPPPKPPILKAPLPLNLPALVALRGKRVILASQSPRRRQLLAQIGLRDVECIPSTFEENLSKSLSPMEYVLQTATKKALDVYEREIDNKEKGDPELIVAADTVVVSHFGQILEKPRSENQHIEMLHKLRDEGVHTVFTSVIAMRPLESALDPGYLLESHVEETSVRFDPSVTDDLLLAYVRTREGADKAGGYGIQGMGSILVERIEGTFDNVVGLPLRATLQLIEKVMAPEEEIEERMEDALEAQFF